MKKILTVIFLVLAGVAASAQSFSYGIDTKRDEQDFASFRKQMQSIHRSRPTVALVLSGGGAKGAAHIGTIRALEKENIPVDLVLGTSIGGLVGGLYACGYTADELEQIMKGMDWDYVLTDYHPRKYDSMTKKEYDSKYEIAIPFGSAGKDFFSKELTTEATIRTLMPDGVVHGQNVRNTLSSLLVGYEDDTNFLRLPRPFICIAADMVSGEQKVWHSGSLVDAMRSTMSIPGLFKPIKKNGMVLVDGGMLNNYPASLAAKLGADIIIGVDISSPGYTEQEINNLIDIVYQALDVMGRSSYEAGRKATSVYIHPDLTGYSMMSFDSESIAEIINRGNEAAKSSEQDISAVRKKLRKAVPGPSPDKARSIVNTPVRVDKIDFDGVSLKDKIYLRRMLNMGEIVTKEDLDHAVYTLVGTSAFESVTYDVLGTYEPYDVVFHCKLAPVNQLGASARFDTIDFASLMVNAGFNARRLTGNRVDITGRLGLNSFLDARYSYRTSSGFDFGADAMIRYANNGHFYTTPFEIQMNFFQTRANVFAGFMKWNAISLKVGASLDFYNVNSILIDYKAYQEGAVDGKYYSRNMYGLVWFNGKTDTLDDPFFPTRGVVGSLNAAMYLPGILSDSPLAYSLQGGVKAAFSAGRFTAIPYIDFRYYSGTSIPYRNYLSAGMAGRTLDHQIPFVGVASAVACGNTMAMAGLDLRLRLWTKHFITLKGEYGRHSDFKDFFTAEGNNMYGVALEYAYKLIEGPVKIDAHWSNLTKKFGVYISLGFDF